MKSLHPQDQPRNPETQHALTRLPTRRLRTDPRFIPAMEQKSWDKQDGLLSTRMEPFCYTPPVPERPLHTDPNPEDITLTNIIVRTV